MLHTELLLSIEKQFFSHGIRWEFYDLVFLAIKHVLIMLVSVRIVKPIVISLQLRPERSCSQSKANVE